MKRRIRPATGFQRPWSPDEDARLAEIVRIGLDSYYWKLAFPARRFGEIAERRLELKLPLAPLV